MQKTENRPKAARSTYTDDCNTESPLNARVSNYRHSKDNIGGTTTIRAELEAIKNGKIKNVIEKCRSVNDEEYARLKQWLSMTCFQGVMRPKRGKDYLTDPSGVLCIDFDGFDRQQAEYVRNLLRSCPFVFSAWLSPSAHGVKALFRVNIANDAECKHAFNDIADYLLREYGLTADPQCKDFGRTCYRSYDKSLWIAENAELFHYSIPEEEPMAAVARTTPISIFVKSSKRLEGYTLAVLNGELEHISNAGRGHGTAALYRAAIRAGELSFTGLFCREPVEDRFIQAFLSRGHSYNSPEHARTTFANGWNLGESKPRQLPPEVLE